MPVYKTTLEYKKKSKETPFETFLKYTDEKERSSKVLAEILKRNINKKQIDFLDIGTGNGEYLRMVLDKAKLPCSIKLILLEPSKDLVVELKKEIQKFPNGKGTMIVQNAWEDYQTEKKFDVILASHLYHIRKEDYYSQLKKMLNRLKDDGILIFIMRNIDDPYDFKMSFKPRLFGEQFRVKILNEATDVFNQISKKEMPLKIERYESISELHIPYKKSRQDAISIIEFYLNKYWEEIPIKLQKEIMGYIAEKRGLFKQIDGLAVIRKAK